MPGDQDEDWQPEQKVGYRRPPAAHRFEKGKSGNPLGRPRKAHRPIQPTSVSEVYLIEAQRKLRVHEDGKTADASALQIAIRSQGMAAAKGNLKAQKDFTSGTRQAELERRHASQHLLEASLEYKDLCEELLNRHRARGWAPPTFNPSPDDIIIDPNRQIVKFTEHSRHRVDAACAAATEVIDSLETELFEIHKLLALDPGNAFIQHDITFLVTLIARARGRLC